MKTILEAIKEVKEASKEKFDATVEVHFNLDLDIKKGQTVRYSITLPYGTGKTKKVAVLASQKVANADLELTEEDIDNIVRGKLQPKVDFDVIVTEPRYMPKLAKAAKILGPAGLMPNPKTGTVTDNVEKAVENIKKGQVEVKTEKEAPLIHTIIGKVSFKPEDLAANFLTLFNSLKQNKPQKSKPEWIQAAFVVSSMGSSVEVDLTELQ
jgi:large subunit ribosomal protein L1